MPDTERTLADVADDIREMFAPATNPKRRALRVTFSYTVEFDDDSYNDENLTDIDSVMVFAIDEYVGQCPKLRDFDVTIDWDDSTTTTQ